MDSIKNGWNNLTERVSGSVSGIFQSKPETAMDSLQESTVVTQTAGKRRRKRTYKNKKSKSKKNLKKGKKYNTRKRK